jgi:hypothetical protein
MRSVLTRANYGLRWGLVGLLSGLLSCAMTQSRIIYLAREQKTLDHVVWPGMVFALVVLLPMTRWAGDGWRRTAAALIASSAVYPLAWRIAATSTIGHSVAFMVAAFTFAGLLGSSVLASAFLYGRFHWVRTAGVTVIAGTTVGGLMGANLAAATTIVHWPFPAGTGLGLFMVLWQAVVGASLGRGVETERSTSGGTHRDGRAY